MGPPNAPRRPGRSELALAAAAVLILAGSFLPWLGRDGRTASSWDLPIASMFRGRPTGGPSTGIVLLLVAGVVGALAAVRLASRMPRPAYTLLLASVTFDVGLVAVMASIRVDPHLNLGAGAIMTLAGAFLLGADALLTRSRWRAAASPGAMP